MEPTTIQDTTYNTGLSFSIGGLFSGRVQMELLWVVLGQFVATLGSLAALRLFTTVLEPHVFGDVALAMTGATLLQLLSLGPLGQGSLRFLAAAAEQAQLPAYVQAVTRLAVYAIVVIVACALLAAASAVASGNASLMPLVLWTAAYGIVAGLESMLGGIQNAARHRVIVAWHQGLGQWLKMGATFLIITSLGVTSHSVIAAFTAAATIVLASQALLFHARILKASAKTVATPEDVRKWTNVLGRYALPFATWGVFSWLQTSSDRWSLQLLGAPNDTGVYAALYQVGFGPTALVSGVVVQLLGPMVFGCAGDGSSSSRVGHARSLTHRAAVASFLVTLALAASTAVYHRSAFALLVGPEYRDASPFLPLMILAGGIFATGQIVAINLMSAGQPQRLVRPKIGSALTGIGFNIAGAHLFGFAGVVYAALLTSALYCGWILRLSSLHRVPSA